MIMSDKFYGRMDLTFVNFRNYGLYLAADNLFVPFTFLSEPESQNPMIALYVEGYEEVFLV